MKPHFPKDFEQNYHAHLKRLKLNGMQAKTIEAYSLAVRRAGERFEYQIDALTEQQLSTGSTTCTGGLKTMWCATLSTD